MKGRIESSAVQTANLSRQVLKANDVSMIIAAHVGVGLCGKEGAQAARSGDFALGEFRLRG